MPGSVQLQHYVLHKLNQHGFEHALLEASALSHADFMSDLHLLNSGQAVLSEAARSPA